MGLETKHLAQVKDQIRVRLYFNCHDVSSTGSFW